VGVSALFGVLFTAPQYFQAILGTDAMGSGLRLLPLIGGLGSVRAAFVDGMDVMLWVCAAIAVTGVLLALVFLPGRAATAGATQAGPAALEDGILVRG
jgi:hypothetical protein